MQIEFDEDQAMKKIRNDLKEEKQELKVILNEEFGLYKKDQTTLEHKKKEAPVFKFEFTDEEKEKKTPEIEQNRKWWKKEKDKKQEIDFVIDNSEL